MNTVTTMNTAVKTASVSLVVDNTKPLTMSTRQIAELTGKNHKDVMRDFRRMIDSLEKGSELAGRNFALGYFVESSYFDKNNQSRPMYELDEDLCNTLVMGYDAPLRFKVAKEWRLMKEGNQKPVIVEDLNDPAYIEAMFERGARLARENKRLVDLHIRRAIDAHSLTRLLGEKRGSTKVQRILKGLCEAKHIERRLDASGKPCGYDVLPPAYMYARQSVHGQLEFTVDVLSVLVELGLIEEETVATLKLPQPNNARAIVNNTAALIRKNAGSLEYFGI
ncbi:Rha family transcriptional regulator [Escherichia coli]|uniref:Rha family transcriptional regulator n=1 Tax=Escherichia coli TaxID=562 RepID=UPI001328ECB0|nr:Rha family transcriptional regulator [Escherichia coli]KAB2983337.1 Rha family transcriptional regulator [Escherichia coli]KAB2993597.1 Rha family transcriptional regulator [Escherichia coli]KAB3049281.1 Rha family transcriptional regulator [Escherichia coli]